MKSLEQIESSSLAEVLSFLEQHDDTKSLLTKSEVIELSLANKTVERLQGKVVQLTEAIVGKVQSAVNESDYDGSFEGQYGISEDEASDLARDFGGSIAYELGLEFDGEELWESSSC
jgi:hypothetical protein